MSNYSFLGFMVNEGLKNRDRHFAEPPRKITTHSCFKINYDIKLRYTLAS